jgi:aspartate 1-decarboxylase
VQTGDKVIIMSYGEYEPEEMDRYAATVVHVGDDNRVMLVDDNPAGAVPDTVAAN